MKSIEATEKQMPIPDLLGLYELLVTTREFELAVAKINARKSLPENPHLCVGQEAIGVGACYNLRRSDSVMPSLRGRSVLITKGVPLGVLLAGIYGKATGPSRGKHTTHHMGDLDFGVLPSSLLIGSQIPIAVGTALASKYQGKDDVCLCFFGDGASNRGDFHEALNIAAIQSLPVVFVCENNHYAIDTNVKDSMRIENIADRAGSYGMIGKCIDGNDVLQVHQTVQEAISKARSGEGPSLIECKTYRYRTHSERFKEERPKEELAQWMERCPIKLYEEHLFNTEVLNQSKKDEIYNRVNGEISKAIEFAENSPYPDPKELFDDVYTNGYIKDGRLCMK